MAPRVSNDNLIIILLVNIQNTSFCSVSALLHHCCLENSFFLVTFSLLLIIIILSLTQRFISE